MSIVEFRVSGEALWNRMERAVERVNERLRRTVAILEQAAVPYAVVGSHAVRVVIAGEMVRPGEHEPNPDVEPVVRTTDFRTVPLETLVRMKLNAFRDKDRVHLRDMISLGMIDASWLDRLPAPFKTRLSELLADPDG